MLKNGKKVFVVAVRYNPQLGDYLTNGEIATVVAVNKNTFRAKMPDWDGSMKTVTYCISRNGRHVRKEADRSVYGSMSHFAFDDRAQALDFLKIKRLSYSGIKSREDTCDKYAALVESGMA